MAVRERTSLTAAPGHTCHAGQALWTRPGCGTVPTSGGWARGKGVRLTTSGSVDQTGAPGPTEAARLAALASFQILDTEPDPAYDDLARVAAALYDAPMSMISLIDENRQWFKARVGIEPASTPREAGVCPHVVTSRQPLVVPDLAADVRFAALPLVVGPPGVRFYAGVPLVDGEGHALGTLCVLDVRPRRLDPDRLEVLAVLGRQVVAHLELGRARVRLQARSDELRAVSGHLRALLHHADAPIYVKDRDGRFVVANPALHAVLGLPDGTLQGRSEAEFLPPDLVRLHHENDDEVRRLQTPRVFEEQTPHSDGTVHVFLSTTFPVPDGGDSSALVGGISLDVTSLRDAQDARARICAVLHAATEQAIFATDAEGSITLVNRGAELLLGRPEGDLLGRSPLLQHDAGEVTARAAELKVPDGVAALLDEPRRSGVETREWTYVAADGRRLTVALSVTAMRDPDGSLAGFTFVAVDITAQRLAELALRESEERFRRVFDDAAVGMTLIDLRPGRSGRLLRVNRAVCQMFGYRQEELVDRGFEVFYRDEDVATGQSVLAALAAGEIDHAQAERQYRHASGRLLWVDVSTSVVYDRTGAPACLVSQLQDITARKAAQAELTLRALHDPLTGLPNRTLLLDHLDQALARNTRAGTRAAVLFLDLDDFKVVNDSLGHDVGDEFLVAIAGRIGSCLRDTDTAARFGGDEFVVLCADLDQPGEAQVVARRLDRALRQDVVLRGHVLVPSASIGVAVSRAGSTPESLLADADAAMYRAKEHGKGRYELADGSVRGRAARQISLEAELRQGLDRDEFALLYQPCLDLATDRVVAVEALLRWDHPVRGLLTPDQFLDVAEERDIMAPLGAWVLDEACRQAASWEAELGDGAPELWVNISSRQLGRHELAGIVQGALDRSGLPARRLWLELTERQLLSAAHSARRDLLALPELGVRLAIDDFGTGTYGLEHLRTIPVSGLKIDRSFVAGLGADRTDTALTVALVSLARSLEMTCVAEGIETSEQRRLLQDLGCDLGQGFLLGRPEPPEVVHGRLRSKRAQR